MTSEFKKWESSRASATLEIKVTASKTYEWFTENHVESTIIFGNSFVDDHDGNKPNIKHWPLNGKVAKKDKTKTAKKTRKALVTEVESQATQEDAAEGTKQKIKKKEKKAPTDVNKDEENLIPKPITIGTGCSGMDIPVLAMKKLNINMVHKFSADNCPKALKTITANFNPEIKYGSMQMALDEEREAQLDVFVAGIPCQPFSQCGSGKGFDDEKDGLVFFTVLQFVNQKLPRSFILENVLGMKNHNGGKTFKLVMEKLRESGRCNVHEKIVKRRTTEYRRTDRDSTSSESSKK